MVKSIAWSLGVIRKPTHEEIAHVAFHLFLERGSIPGYEEQDWIRAQRLLIEKLNEPEPLPPKAILRWQDEVSSHARSANLANRTRTAMGESPRRPARTPLSPFRPSSSDFEEGRSARSEVKALVEG